MKNRMIILVVGALMACLLPQAVWAQQEWQSTSTMQGSGSAYSSQVTTVGAANVGNMATTTYSQSPSMASGRRRINDGGTNNDGGHTEDENSPRRCGAAVAADGGRLRALYCSAQTERDSVTDSR